MEYQYSTKDHIKFPEKYQMTPFEDIEFLKAYKKSRESNLELLKKNVGMIDNFDDILKKIPFKQENKFYKKIKTDNINTEKLLKFLYVEVIENKKRNEELLSALIKKFEIKKKIIEFYNFELKENTTKFSNLKNYILLSLICLLKYEKTKNLKFLNVSLKLNDTISSQIKKLVISEDILLYSFIIRKELEMISALCNKKGVSYG